MLSTTTFHTSAEKHFWQRGARHNPVLREMSDFLRESRLNDALHPPDGAHKQSSVFSNRRRSYSIASDLLCYEVWSLAGHLRHNCDCSKFITSLLRVVYKGITVDEVAQKISCEYCVISFLLSTCKASHNNLSRKNELATFVLSFPMVSQLRHLITPVSSG